VNLIKATKGSYHLLIMKDMMHSIKHLVGKKGASMTMSKFTKLANINGMTNTSFIKTQYELLFKRTLSKLKVAHMTLEVFYDALESLADTLYPLEFDKLDVLITNITKSVDI
jgi:hypothetical protein